MRRRDFLGVLGSAAVTWSLAARAGQSATPVIGFLSIRSQGDDPHLLTAFHQGLKEVDYVVGPNVTMEYRWGSRPNCRSSRQRKSSCTSTSRPPRRSVIGGIEETSASSEARSTPRSYPTK
jgi:hypothetical protein